MKVDFDTRALKIDPRAFYWWATLTLGCEVIVALGCRAWLLALAVTAIDGAAYWRLRTWVRRAHMLERMGRVLGDLQDAGIDPRGSTDLSALAAVAISPQRAVELEEAPEPRRVHGRCMGCQQEIFFDPAAQNAGVCEACVGGPG